MKRATGKSSKPTRETSSGTRSPRCVNRVERAKGSHVVVAENRRRQPLAEQQAPHRLRAAFGFSISVRNEFGPRRQACSRQRRAVPGHAVAIRLQSAGVAQVADAPVA